MKKACCRCTRRLRSLALTARPARLQRPAFQSQNRQVPASMVELDLKFPSHAGLPLHKCPRLGTWRPARPTLAWFKSRRAVGGEAVKADLVGCAAAKHHVRTRFVVPTDDEFDFKPKDISPQR